MPYITQDRREVLDSGARPASSGELAYQLTRLSLGFLTDTGLGFATLALVVGVLESVKHEIQRRVVDGYEDLKEFENGDLVEFEDFHEFIDTAWGNAYAWDRINREDPDASDT